METKIFTQKNKGISINPDGSFHLYDSERCFLVIPPQNLIKQPMSDEELANKHCVDYYNFQEKNRDCSDLSAYTHWLAGRKSYGDKEFDLSESELKGILLDYISEMKTANQIINSLKHTPTYPTSITVPFDGENYLFKEAIVIYE